MRIFERIHHLLDCLWTIRGPAGSSLSLDFSDLEIGPARFNPNANRTGENCSRDYVQISEENITGETEERPFLPNFEYRGTYKRHI